MNQLTLSGFDEELAGRIRHLANQEGLSLSQAALRLLRLGGRSRSTKGHRRHRWVVIGSSN